MNTSLRTPTASSPRPLAWVLGVSTLAFLCIALVIADNVTTGYAISLLQTELSQSLAGSSVEAIQPKEFSLLLSKEQTKFELALNFYNLTKKEDLVQSERLLTQSSLSQLPERQTLQDKLSKAKELQITLHDQGEELSRLEYRLGRMETPTEGQSPSSEYSSASARIAELKEDTEHQNVAYHTAQQELIAAAQETLQGMTLVSPSRLDVRIYKKARSLLPQLNLPALHEQGTTANG